MLHTLLIRNIAIADNIEVEWKQGMTAISGETGAGKSILLNGLSLALGERADSSVVRHGEKRAEVTATFQVGRIPAAMSWLSERDLDQGEDCILRRTVSTEGRSRAYINGQPVPLTELKGLGEMLIDIHSQHAHQSLLRIDTHRNLLDDYAGLTAEAQAVRHDWIRWQGKARQYHKLKEQADENSARQQLLNYQFEELSALAPEAGEVEALDVEFHRYSQTETLVSGTYSARQCLEPENDGPGALDGLKQALHELHGLQDTNPALSNAIELLDSALIQGQEAVSDLDHYLGSFDVDDSRVKQVEERLDKIHTLARKHQVRSEDLHGLIGELETELTSLVEAVDGLDDLATEVTELAKAYQHRASDLSQQRQAAAKRMADDVMEKLHQLAMPGARFDIHFKALDKPSPDGLDQIEFLVSMNAGQPVRPLGKVASGGELSRISLAIQVICAEHSTIPTLVFDEVDVGISGATAEIVGLMLRSVGERGQVICVTHLPQVAAQGHNHCVVSKEQQGEVTRTRILPIEQESRIDEVARMLGGIDITAQTRAHAEEMLMRQQRQH
jgi:DNA repair protein RecN (Recombination protein N)